MPSEVAIEYVNIISRLVKDDGVFVSMNGHRRGQYEVTGVERVSDYGYSNFELLNFSYKPHFSSSYDDFGHCAVCLVNRRSKVDTDVGRELDIFGDLFALGINKDIDLILAKFNDRNMSKADEDQMLVWESVLLERNVESSDIVTRYIQFVRKALVDRRHNKFEEEFLFNTLESPQARYYVKLSSYLNGKWSDDDIHTLNSTPALVFLGFDLIKYSRGNFIMRKTHGLIRKAHLVKKLFPRNPLKVPVILKARQVYDRFRRLFL